MDRRDCVDGRREEKISCHHAIEASIQQRFVIPTTLSWSSSMGTHYVGDDRVAFLLEQRVCCEMMYFFVHCTVVHVLQRAQCTSEGGYPLSFNPLALELDI